MGQLLHPQLTTIRQDLNHMGRAAALSLLHRLGEQDTPPVPHVSPPQLIIRESTAEPR
ncbi:substrate-binding domain-containing protein [Streptomyces kunmingensis]|uniref:Substrate-binding domain-containing protein n=1 Tax=Streptomyces kunmingensis TaxID=68225 RepID=A0ABU6C226_9ACTN|nr:substrate-binding domain-containing protein [Streptomyces kunmingensis]MEB3958762.1 substrate-binding domain-containing protein [Streptomyces kunmingensis]